MKRSLLLSLLALSLLFVVVGCEADDDDDAADDDDVADDDDTGPDDDDSSSDDDDSTDDDDAAEPELVTLDLSTSETLVGGAVAEVTFVATAVADFDDFFEVGLRVPPDVAVTGTTRFVGTLAASASQTVTVTVEIPEDDVFRRIDGYAIGVPRTGRDAGGSTSLDINAGGRHLASTADDEESVALDLGLDLVAAAAPRNGGSVSLTLDAVAGEALENLTVEILLPDGATVTDGALSVGPVSAAIDQAFSLTATVQLPASADPLTLLGLARVGEPETATFGGARRVVLETTP